MRIRFLSGWIRFLSSWIETSGCIQPPVPPAPPDFDFSYITGCRFRNMDAQALRQLLERENLQFAFGALQEIGCESVDDLDLVDIDSDFQIVNINLKPIHYKKLKRFLISRRSLQNSQPKDDSYESGSVLSNSGDCGFVKPLCKASECDDQPKKTSRGNTKKTPPIQVPRTTKQRKTSSSVNQPSSGSVSVNSFVESCKLANLEVCS